MGEVLSRTWWVGGSPCSGKTTLARRLARDVGGSVYSCDDAFDRHAGAVDEESGPTLRKVTEWDVGRRLAQPVEVQVRDVFALYREEWPLVLADLRALHGPVVVEGAALLPELVVDLEVPVDRAVWVVPTEAFQREHYARRPWAMDVLRCTRDPAESFERWMERDARFALEVAEQARELGRPVQVTAGDMSLEEAHASLRRTLAMDVS